MIVLSIYWDVKWVSKCDTCYSWRVAIEMEMERKGASKWSKSFREMHLSLRPQTNQYILIQLSRGSCFDQNKRTFHCPSNSYLSLLVYEVFPACTIIFLHQTFIVEVFSLIKTYNHLDRNWQRSLFQSRSVLLTLFFNYIMFDGSSWAAAISNHFSWHDEYILLCCYISSALSRPYFECNFKERNQKNYVTNKD